LLAKLALVVDERISRHRIRFLMSPAPTEVDIGAMQISHVASSKSLLFRSSVNRMEGLKGRLTSELSALRSELDVRPSVEESSPRAPAMQPAPSALSATLASERKDHNGLSDESTPAAARLAALTKISAK
jgi:hypothetical protein